MLELSAGLDYPGTQVSITESSFAPTGMRERRLENGPNFARVLVGRPRKNSMTPCTERISRATSVFSYLLYPMVIASRLTERWWFGLKG